MYRKTLFWFCWITVSSLSAEAAEIRLREHVTNVAPIVSLGHVAEVVEADARLRSALERVDLFPAPKSGSVRRVTVNELQRLLQLHGVDVARHEFTGPEQVVVVSSSHASQAPDNSDTQQRLQAAIVQYLGEVADSEAIWKVSANLDAYSLPRSAREFRDIRVSGGRAPWSGTQQFQCLLLGRDQTVFRLPVDAEVRRAATVVVATHALVRGDRIYEGDVVLQEADDQRPVGAQVALHEVVGREVTQSMAAGTVIDPQRLKRVLLVRRRDLLTVSVQVESLKLSLKVVAKEDGALHDVIRVENPVSGKTFSARVTGTGRAVPVGD